MKQAVSYYLSLVLLFVPAIFFGILVILNLSSDKFFSNSLLPILPWQFYVIAFFGIVATIGGVLDWHYHRYKLKMKIPKKERNSEVMALGLGGVPMFFLMWFSMMSTNPRPFLIPIVLILIYTVTAISYDEFTFHAKRCKRLETIYHRMLVLGNGVAWLAWFHFIYG